MKGQTPRDGPGRRTTPRTAAIGFVLALALAGVLSFAASQPARAADVSLTLYANVLGFSTTPGGEGNPGPTLVVNEGDLVQLQLTSEDGLQHGLFIDYNGNGAPDGSDYISPITTGTVTDSFTASTVGQFTYYDQVVTVNQGAWVTIHVNRPPTATISAPTTGTSWTGGLAHDITFDVSDPDGDALQVTLTYTYNGGAGQGPIQGPFPAGPNPNLVSWTPTGFSATDTIIHLVVQDGGGLTAAADSPAFEVDSTVPTIASSSPAAGATGVDRNSQIWVTWSERMDEAATGSPTAFGVRRAGGPWVPGSVTWSTDAMRMSFRPTSTLDSTTSFEVHVNATAKDHSVPGNAFAGPAVWTFMTSSVVDQTPPAILAAYADPPTQISGGFVNLTADVTDAGGIGAVTAHVTGPAAFDENLTMAPSPGTQWYLRRAYSNVGHYDVDIWAMDTRGNAASQPLGFDIGAGNGSLPTPASVTATFVDGVVEVTWSPIASPYLFGYNVYRGDAMTGPFTKITITPFPASGATAYRDGSVEGGRTYFYTVTAVNTTGGESPRARPSSVTIPPFHSPPIFNPLPWAIAGVTLGVILGAIYGLVWRRRTA